MIGTTISHFRITEKLGEGGMGEVFRAEDTNLGRDVALKLLPESVAGDAERLGRFEREARVLAALNHPNIAAIHELVEADGRRLLVMEVAEGEDLEQILKRGPLDVDAALRLALQIASALETAHERGIVHRDLKPANIVVSKEGTAKILDFGLAKALGDEWGLGADSETQLRNSPTLTRAQMTTAGVIMGTAGYMSPEQARGATDVDQRADIWAFGCVLYEILVGKRTFAGSNLADVLAAIVHSEPDLDALPSATPRSVRVLIERCLRKDTGRRLQAIGDARVVLQDYLDDPTSEATVGSPVVPSGQGLSRYLPWGVAALALLFSVWAFSRADSGAASEPIRRLTVRMGVKPYDQTIGAAMDLSKDGRSIAYVAGSNDDQIELTVRPFDQDEGLVLTRGVTAGSAPYHPFFSPDNQWLGFVTASELRKVSVTGGAAIKLADVSRSRGATWGEDGTIVYAPSTNGGLYQISQDGGEPQPFTELLEGEQSHRWPQWLPGGKALLFTTTSENLSFANGSIEVLDVASGERKELHRGAIYPRYIPTGHLLYVSDRTLFARPFDAKRLEFTGSPVPMVDDVDANWAEGGAQFATSDSGLLVYLESRRQGQYAVVSVSRAGIDSPVWTDLAYYANPQITRDGKRLSLSVMRDGDWDVWAYDLERQVATRLTFAEGYDADQIWSPDGKQIAFSSNREGPSRVFLKQADGSGSAVPLEGLEAAYEAAPDGLYPTSWSIDGDHMLFQTSTGGGDIWSYSFAEKAAKAFLGTPQFSETNPVFSPDGRWVAYESNESGQLEIYIASFPSASGKWQISDGGAGQPHWSGDSKELFFRTNDGIESARLDVSGTSVRAQSPQTLFRGAFLGGTRGIQVPGYVFPDYTVFPDGESFILFAEPFGNATEEPELLHLVTGWFQEVEERTRTSR